jgi:hypothetical protein
MALDLAKVHVFEKQKGTSRVVLTRSTPYVRISEQGHAPVFVNRTGAFHRDGSRAEVDDWLKERCEALSKEAKRDIDYPKCIEGRKPEGRKPGRPPKRKNGDDGDD